MGPGPIEISFQAGQTSERVLGSDGRAAEGGGQPQRRAAHPADQGRAPVSVGRRRGIHLSPKADPQENH